MLWLKGLGSLTQGYENITSSMFDKIEEHAFFKHHPSPAIGRGGLEGALN
jgi:hypothetical protein